MDHFRLAEAQTKGISPKLVMDVKPSCRNFAATTNVGIICQGRRPQDCKQESPKLLNIWSLAGPNLEISGDSWKALIEIRSLTTIVFN